MNIPIFILSWQLSVDRLPFTPFVNYDANSMNSESLTQIVIIKQVLVIIEIN